MAKQREKRVAERIERRGKANHNGVRLNGKENSVHGVEVIDGRGSSRGRNRKGKGQQPTRRGKGERETAKEKKKRKGRGSNQRSATANRIEPRNEKP